MIIFVFFRNMSEKVYAKTFGFANVVYTSASLNNVLQEINAWIKVAIVFLVFLWSEQLKAMAVARSVRHKVYVDTGLCVGDSWLIYLKSVSIESYHQSILIPVPAEYIVFGLSVLLSVWDAFQILCA